MVVSILLARRYLHHPGGGRRLAGVVAVVGVSAGVMLLLVVMAVLNGLADDIKSRIARTESHIRITREDGPAVDIPPERVISAVGRERFAGMGRFVQGEILLMHRGRTAGAVLYGVDMAGIGRSEQLEAMLEDDCSREWAPGGLVLGRLLAQRVWVIPGDTVLIATPKELMPRPGGRPPRLARRRVACVFESGLPDFDASLAFMPTDEAALLLEGQSTPGLEVWLRDPSDATGATRRLRSALGGADSLQVRHWGELNRSLFDALRVEKAAMFVVMALVILIAGFNITGGILRNVIARRSDIAILLTMGCSRSVILEVFVLEGVLIGTAGATVGSALGLGLGEIIRRSGFLRIPGDLMPFTSIPLTMRPGDVVMVTLATILITTLSAAYPAYRASRLDPVAILRDL